MSCKKVPLGCYPEKDVALKLQDLLTGLLSSHRSRQLALELEIESGSEDPKRQTYLAKKAHYIYV